MKKKNDQMTFRDALWGDWMRFREIESSGKLWYIAVQPDNLDAFVGSLLMCYMLLAVGVLVLMDAVAGSIAVFEVCVGRC